MFLVDEVEGKNAGKKNVNLCCHNNFVRPLSYFKYIQNPFGSWDFNYTLNKSL